MAWLITGFEPFAGETINPSAVVAQSISRQIPADCLILPVVYDRAFEALRKSLETGKYQGVVCLGQAAGRSKVGLERFALNLDDSEKPDNERGVRIETAIDPDGPSAIMNALPLREIVRKLADRVGPVEISSSAGTFVCNSLYYKVFRWMHENPDKLRWQLFVHLPYLPEQAMGKPDWMPFMAQAAMEQAVLEIFRELKAY